MNPHIPPSRGWIVSLQFSAKMTSAEFDMPFNNNKKAKLKHMKDKKKDRCRQFENWAAILESTLLFRKKNCYWKNISDGIEGECR